MIESSPLGLVLMCALLLLIGVMVSLTRWPNKVKLILYAALGLRVVGALGREAIAADAAVYYQWGLRYAEYFSRFDLSPLWDAALWRGPFLGTNMVGYPTGFFITVFGPSRFGVFLAFALVGLAGVAAYAVAFRRAFPRATYWHYWAWVFLFPSIWFWPSSIGKEAIMMLGLGLATLGFVGKGRRENWPLLVAGLAVVFFIRPQVAAVFVVAVVFAHWLSFRDWSPGRVLQGSVIMAVGLVGIWFAIVNSKVGGLDVESIEGYVETTPAPARPGRQRGRGGGGRPGGDPVRDGERAVPAVHLGGAQPGVALLRAGAHIHVGAAVVPAARVPNGAEGVAAAPRAPLRPRVRAALRDRARDERDQPRADGAAAYAHLPTLLPAVRGRDDVHIPAPDASRTPRRSPAQSTPQADSGEGPSTDHRVQSPPRRACPLTRFRAALGRAGSRAGGWAVPRAPPRRADGGRADAGPLAAYDVAATWATVGFLFARSRDELEAASPAFNRATQIHGSIRTPNRRVG